MPTEDTSKAPCRILLSAFACSPIWGSEPGVGWQWLVQLARQHHVVLITHAFFREHLEPALAAAGVKVEAHYFQAGTFGLHPHIQLNSRAYYTWWQWRLRALVKRLIAEQDFDFIHHLTWGTLRFPCLLGGMGVPLVMGPLGGGETAPLRFFGGLPFKVRAFDYLRSLSLLWVRLDPLATWGPKRAALVLCKSVDSLRALPRSVQSRAVVMPEIGSPAVDLSQRVAQVKLSQCDRRFRMLFAGRLLGWKGVAIALNATVRMVRDGLDVQLDIAGDGPLRTFLIGEVARHGLQDRVKLLGVIPRPDLMSLYGRADLFVFPSLHDSSGNVVLEALSRGLPVVCLDLGGPSAYINDSCGVVIKTAGLSKRELENRLADVLAALVRDPVRVASMSRSASEHARRQSWEATVRNAYGVIGARLAGVGA